jgi:hypothetical protein
MGELFERTDPRVLFALNCASAYLHVPPVSRKASIAGPIAFVHFPPNIGYAEMPVPAGSAAMG